MQSGAGGSYLREHLMFDAASGCQAMTPGETPHAWMNTRRLQSRGDGIWHRTKTQPCPEAIDHLGMVFL
jgi:hypothetical protein